LIKDIIVTGREMGDEDGDFWIRLFSENKIKSGEIKKGFLKGRLDGKDWHYQKEEYTEDEDDSDLADVATPNRGGIDLTHANMNLQVKKGIASPFGIKFHLDPAMLAQLQNAPGFMPVIINIQPLKSLPDFLGLKQESAEQEALS